MTSFSGKKLTCIRGERVVFNDLDFSINEGEVLYLKGPNGSGKSTLLRLMAGLLRPVNGTLTWNNKNIYQDEGLFRSLTHYVGHQDAVKTALTVEENLRFWAEMNSDIKEKSTVQKALQEFSLDSFSTLPARFLSAGQRKRLNLARLCTTWAPLWLLDEPSNSLDSDSVNVLTAAISTHQKKGGIVAIATHENLDVHSNSLDISMFTNFKIKSRDYDGW
ncbi:MAG TPA: heme ABC exporter ATP-binding protein CcmA [Rhodospirillales bacterium]|jgi:heme exporter protein A|nr:heme ABC exporter ATP-binding protein CcmA [Rhodospirillales bacterium]HIL75304.1 heme ABC exporter ATP-binding protein CcmA [Rhodospirillales bacterium]